MMGQTLISARPFEHGPGSVDSCDSSQRTIEELRAKVNHLTRENEKIRALHSDSSSYAYKVGQENDALLMTIRILMAKVDL